MQTPLLRLIRTPETIFDDAELYLRIYMMGYPFLLLYDFGTSALRARGDSRYPFLALMLSSIANIALNLFFVIVFRMGVAGVAIATDISTMPSALMVLHRLARDDLFCLTLHRPKFSLKIAGKILKTGIPSAVQGAVFCFANIFVQASVNSFGETTIAGSTIAMNFEYFTYYVITAFGQTATTFTSQNHAAGQNERCRHILWSCLGLSVVCSSIPIFTIVLFRDFFSGFFTPESAVIESAAVRILCILLFEPMCNLYEIPAGVLRGSGHALSPAVSTMTGTCAFRILWLCTVFQANPTLPVLYHAFPLSWVTAILLVNIGFLLQSIDRCPVATTVSLIGSKWKLLIIRNLLVRPWRFNELKRDLEGISQKVLTDSLRSMEEDGLITRTVFPEVPPRVEYALSDLGKTLKPILDSMVEWGTAYKKM